MSTDTVCYSVQVCFVTYMLDSRNGQVTAARPAELCSCCLQDMFAASVETPTSSNPRRGRKWYFERLEVQTIKCNVTLIPRPGSRDVESGLSPGRIRMAATLGVNFIDINNVPLKINALAFQNALLTPGTLMSHITRHLINSVSPCYIISFIQAQCASSSASLWLCLSIGLTW
jgi:hypothetical protein